MAGLAGLLMFIILTGGRYGGVFGAVSMGILGLVAIPVLSYLNDLADMKDRFGPAIRTPEDVQRFMEAQRRGYLDLIELVLRIRMGRPPASDPHVRRSEPVEHRLDGEHRYLPGGGRQEEPGDFWPQLSPEEQELLREMGHTAQFRDGQVICYQGEPGDQLFVIESGTIEVHHDDGGGERLVARRGAGDLVGERSALEHRERSATLIAQGPATVLAIDTSSFARFIERYPETLTKVERRIYDRLNEPRPPVPFRYNGQNCTIVIADISAFSGLHRNDTDRLVIRSVMYRALERASRRWDIPWSDVHREDRGDGTLIIIPPTMSTRAVLQPLIEIVGTVVTEHNERADQSRWLAIRLAVSVGPVTRDREGMVGEAINFTTRLLDARPFKQRLSQAGAGAGLIVSSYVYDNVVRQLPASGTYEQIRCAVKDTRVTGWMSLL